MSFRIDDILEEGEENLENGKMMNIIWQDILANPNKMPLPTSLDQQNLGEIILKLFQEKITHQTCPVIDGNDLGKKTNDNNALDSLIQMANESLSKMDKKIISHSQKNASENNLPGHNNKSDIFSKHGNLRKRRKTRTTFSNSQIAELENNFTRQKYLTPVDRDRIAKKLNLSNTQVITWFQNRRAKMKRESEEIDCDNIDRNGLIQSAGFNMNLESLTSQLGFATSHGVKSKSEKDDQEILGLSEEEDDLNHSDCDSRQSESPPSNSNLNMTTSPQYLNQSMLDKAMNLSNNFLSQKEVLDWSLQFLRLQKNLTE